MIPNIIHFVYGMKYAPEPLFYPYYLGVMSAIKVNKPDAVYFHYHHEPTGKWWNALQGHVIPVKIDRKINIGKFRFKIYAHITDYTRLEILYKYGGIYLDVDTLCIKPLTTLLDNKFVIGEELFDLKILPTYNYGVRGLCNAVMLAEPQSEFVGRWLEAIPEHYTEKFWSSIACMLPRYISHEPEMSGLFTLLPPKLLYDPTGPEMFEEREIPPELMVAHFWGHTELSHLQRKLFIREYILRNPNILYCKLVKQVFGDQILI